MLILNLTFISLAIVMLVYLVRHYIFTLTALYHPRSQPQCTFSDMAHQPSVSVLIPARDEERVIERLLQRMTELTYPRALRSEVFEAESSKKSATYFNRA